MSKEEIYLNGIKCDVFNKYIRKENDMIIIDYLDENSFYIPNNRDIYFDKVEIINGIGIVLYLNTEVIQVIQGVYIEVEFDEDKNIVILKTDKSAGNLYLYYKDELGNTVSKSNSKFNNNKFEIGDIVFPIDIGFYSSTSIENTYNFKPFITVIYALYNKHKGIYVNSLKDLDENYINEIIEMASFKIIDKIGDDFYKLKLCNTDKSMQEYKDVIFFGHDNNLRNLDEIKNS